jgi:hypothetical protein
MQARNSRLWENQQNSSTIKVGIIRYCFEEKKWSASEHPNRIAVITLMLKRRYSAGYTIGTRNAERTKRYKREKQNHNPMLMKRIVRTISPTVLFCLMWVDKA